MEKEDKSQIQTEGEKKKLRIPRIHLSGGAKKKKRNGRMYIVSFESMSL